MALHTENFMKRQYVLLHRRPHKQPWVISWGGAQNFSMWEGWFPISVFPAIWGHIFGRSLVSLVSPLMRQLHMKKLPVVVVALPAIQHHHPRQGIRGALFLFCCFHHTVCPLEADNTFLSVCDFNIHYIIYSFVALNNCTLIAVKQQMPNKSWCCTHPSSICLKHHHLYK